MKLLFTIKNGLLKKDFCLISEKFFKDQKYYFRFFLIHQRFFSFLSTFAKKFLPALMNRAGSEDFSIDRTFPL